MVEERFIKDLEAAEVPFMRGEPLSRHTRMRVGGKARYFVQCRGRDTLSLVMEISRSHQVPFRLMGAGSNLIVGSAGFDGLVIAYRGSAFPPVFNDHQVEADGAQLLTRLSRLTTSRGLAGLEFANEIPGTVGGGVRMNAGAWNDNMASCLESVSILSFNGDTCTRQASDIGLAYRSSGLKPDEVVVQARFHLRWEDPEVINRRLDELKLKRRETQPLLQNSSGCIFKNPPHTSAGELIEKCGLKGLSVGDAAVSRMHANFIINQGQATADQVLALVERIKEEVMRQTGVVLEEEVVVW